jgi:hypothetical protein
MNFIFGIDKRSFNANLTGILWEVEWNRFAGRGTVACKLLTLFNWFLMMLSIATKFQ